MERNEQQSMSSSEVQKRMEAWKVLEDEADATREALIQELTERDRKLADQISKLDKEREDIGHKLAVLSGQLEEAYEGAFRSKRHHIKDEAILALITSDGIAFGKCTSSRIQEYFEFSSATVCRRMNALLAAGKVTMEKQGTTKIWKAV